MQLSPLSLALCATIGISSALPQDHNVRAGAYICDAKNFTGECWDMTFDGCVILSGFWDSKVMSIRTDPDFNCTLYPTTDCTFMSSSWMPGKAEVDYPKQFADLDEIRFGRLARSIECIDF